MSFFLKVLTVHYLVSNNSNNNEFYKFDKLKKDQPNAWLDSFFNFIIQKRRITLFLFIITITIIIIIIITSVTFF